MTTSASLTLSVVVPVLDDAVVLERCLASLAPELVAGFGARADVLVVDASADERARAVCARHGARWSRAARASRGAQLAQGARESEGSALWFLHADSVVAPGAGAALARALEAGASWGAFRLAIDHPSPLVRVIERAANARARLARLPYGDQGLFARRAEYEAAGGFPDAPLGEDLVLARRLARRGPPRILAPALVTDGRRWRELGVLRTSWRNARVLALFALGRSPAELARVYHAPAGRPARGAGT